MDIISCLSILLQFITTVNQHLQAQRLLRCTPLRRRPRRHLCHLGFHLAPYLTGTPTASCQSQVCHSSTPYVISLAFVALSLLQISQLGLHLCHSLRLYSLGYPGEYEDCHGFEIELEDLQCTSVYYTFSANRYGAPKKADTQTGGCLITYESEYDDVNDQWLTTTPVPESLIQGGKVTPTGGHSCFSSGQANYATSGCEHFGVSLGAGGGPTATKYRWLIANSAAPGTLIQSTTRVGIPAVVWRVNVGAGVNGGNVVGAVIEAEPPEPNCGLCAKWGEPKWVKVFVTETEYEVDLDHLLTDGEEVPQSSSETEIEWVLLQSPPACDDETCAAVDLAGGNELDLEAEAGDASKTIVRRYEFYEYTGAVNPDDNEANPKDAGDGCEGDPEPCDIVGNYLGAQMAAAVLGLGDVFEVVTQSPVLPGEEGVSYMLMLTAMGGAEPYTWSLTSGSLFSGMSLTVDGWISGTPTESGSRSLELTVSDANGDTASKVLEMSIIGPTSSPTTSVR